MNAPRLAACWVALGLLLSLLSLEADGAASSSRWKHLFHIGRSNSRNRVDYEVRVDARCKPVGKEPVRAYWRLLSEGPRATEELSLVEQLRAYGIKEQKRVKGGVRIRVAARPSRPALVKTRLSGDRCVVGAWGKFGGKWARVDRIWAKVGERRWWQLPQVHYVDILGKTAGGKAVRERIVP